MIIVEVQERVVIMAREEVLLGNEAIALGLLESGCHVVTSYPGTPSSEILPGVVRFKKELGLDTYVEWSINEKVAFEVALAASWTGKRAAVAMKQVGLNVATDPLTSAAYTGVVGGFVVIPCDDPGPHSSQTEQDTRLFALFAKVPVLDPSSPREAKEMVRTAFALSEKYRLPVILRPAIRICHAKQNIEFTPIEELERKASFKKEPGRWAATPRFRYLLHKELNEKLKRVQEEFEESSLNFRQDGKDGRLGIIAAGASYTILQDTLKEVGLKGEIPILKIGTPYPLPQRLVADFVAGCERVLVLEEPDIAIEVQIVDKAKVLGRLNGFVPPEGELVPEVIYRVLARALQESGITSLSVSEDRELAEAVQALDLPIRKPRLCPGCPHRAATFALKRAFGARAIYTSDIGCYTLGLNLKAVDTVLDMGASISLASGFYQAHSLDGTEVPIVAAIGDSTFLHAGIPPLADAVYTKARFLLVIMDNEITAMTGMQPTADSGVLADGSPGNRVAIPDLVRACGVKWLREIDPYQVEEFTALAKEAYEYVRAEEGGVAVIISKRPCVIHDRTPLLEHPVRVTVTEECDGCKYCLVGFECPSLVLDEELGRVVVDRMTCVDCGVCIDACYQGLIVREGD